MTVFGERQRRRFGDIVQIHETQSGRDRIGNAEHTVGDDAAPGAEDVLHVSGRLQHGQIEARGKQHLLDPQFRPMMRHRLDLRMQHRVKDKALHAVAPRCRGDGARIANLVRADVGADVIDRLRVGRGARQRTGVIETAETDLAGAKRHEHAGMVGITHQGANGSALGRQRLDRGFAGLAGGAGDQDHRNIIAIWPSARTSGPG